ncbi:RidA family protein [Alphaproteobacteria bacterium]|nr:RidA family protein [Alphaproteobacteria bacterium]
MDIKHLVFDDSPVRVGPFSHAVKAGEFLFITGQMPTLLNNPAKLVDGGIIEQTHQVMRNLESVLTNAGSSFSNVVFARVYLVNFQDFDKMNSVYETYFDSQKLPARTCIGVTGLAVGAAVEIDLTAKF